MALDPPLPLSPLLPSLPAEESFSRALGPIDFRNDNNPNLNLQRALLDARRALAELNGLKRKIGEMSDEYFSLDPSQSSCAPQPLPFHTYPSRRLRARTGPSDSSTTDQNGSATTTLNTRPRIEKPVLVPTIPHSVVQQPNWDTPYASEPDLHQYFQKANASPPLLSTGLSLSIITHDVPSNRVQVKLQLGSVGWGYLKLGKRRRGVRFDGAGTGRAGGEGMGMVVIRANIFASNETNKGKNDISSFRSFVDLSTHLTSLESTLPELIYRLPAYLDLPTRPCTSCDRVLRRGIFPVGRAWRPLSKAVSMRGSNVKVGEVATEDGCGDSEKVDGLENDGEDGHEHTNVNGNGDGNGSTAHEKGQEDVDVNMDDNGPPADEIVSGPSGGTVKQGSVERKESEEEGEWLPFHLDCWPKFVGGG